MTDATGDAELIARAQHIASHTSEREVDRLKATLATEPDNGSTLYTLAKWAVDCANRLAQALSERQGQGAGWVLVPREPTEEACYPFENEPCGDGDGTYAGIWGPCYRAMIKAVGRDPPPLSGWRPISEAPRDGTQVLVAAPDCGMMVARWLSGGWDDGDFNSFMSWPTHWQPLPPPPDLQS